MELTQDLIHKIYEQWAQEFRNRMPNARYVFPHVNDADGLFKLYSYRVLDENFINISLQSDDEPDTIALRSIGLSQEIIDLMDGEDLAFETATGKEILSTDAAYKEIYG